MSVQGNGVQGNGVQALFVDTEHPEAIYPRLLGAERCWGILSIATREDTTALTPSWRTLPVSCGSTWLP